MRAKYKVTVGTTLFLAAGLCAFFLRSRLSPPVTTQTHSPIDGSAHTTAPSVSAPLATPEHVTPPPQREIHFMATAPSLEQVRAEVSKDPHGTPPSLLEFASAISRAETLALRSADAMATYWDELRLCIASGSSGLIPAAKAFCLVQADRMARSHPEFAAASKDLQHQADTKTLELARLLMKKH